MKTVIAMSAFALLALSTAAFSQNASNSKSMQQNAAPTGAEKKSGAANTESGPAAGTEGRASASDTNGGTDTPKMKGSTQTNK